MQESGTEDDAQNELLTRYQAVMEDKLSLQFRLQDSESNLERVQTELLAVTQDRDIEGEHTILELRSVIEEMEDSNKSREDDVHVCSYCIPCPAHLSV